MSLDARRSRVNLLDFHSAWAELVWRYLLKVTNTVNPSSIPGSHAQQNYSNLATPGFLRWAHLSVRRSHQLVHIPDPGPNPNLSNPPPPSPLQLPYCSNPAPPRLQRPSSSGNQISSMPSRQDIKKRIPQTPWQRLIQWGQIKYSINSLSL